MADEDLDSGQEKKKSGKLKWIIIILVLLGVLGGGGYFAYTKFFAKPAGDAKADTAEEQPAEAAQGDGILVSLPEFLVNLADPLGRRYLKLGLDVEVVDEKAQAELDKSMPKIKDTMLILLSSKTYEDLSTTQAKIELKQEVVRRLNQVLGNNKVLRVYITDMVIQ